MKIFGHCPSLSQGLRLEEWNLIDVGLDSTPTPGVPSEVAETKNTAWECSLMIRKFCLKQVKMAARWLKQQMYTMHMHHQFNPLHTPLAKLLNW